MNSSTSVYFAFLLLGVAACTSTKVKKEPAESSASKTIDLVAQKWPGQNPEPYSMPIHSGLDQLEFGNPVHAGLDPEDLILGFTHNEDKIAIPLTYLEGFEVANFSLGDQKYLITWCGLVGSAQLFSGSVHGDTSGFDFGRALIGNNLLMVDRKTRTVWNQLSKRAIHGELQGSMLELLPATQTTWGYWKSRFPDTKMLVNQDTAGAAFPSLLFEKPYYTDWEPDSGQFYMEDVHQTDNLGLGLEVDNTRIYFPFHSLHHVDSPVKHKIADQTLSIHFDQAGLTAWATDEQGRVIPGTLTYQWAWTTFYPETLIYQN